MFAWLINRLRANPVAALRSGNKDAWCRTYFPEYAALWDGRYPRSLPVVYAEVGEPIRFSGTTRVVEIAPWEYFDGEDGSVDEYGWKWDIKTDIFGRKVMKKTVASEEEYAKFCWDRNYYRSGNGLNPELLMGAVDRRDSEYKANLEKYQADQQLPKAQRTLLTKPDKFVSPSGTFFPERGPDSVNPWGVNSSFHPAGAKEPTYISKRWGPDYRPDVHGIAGMPVVVEWDVARDGPKPSQADYDKARYSVWL